LVYEIIVIDDCSADSSLGILEKLKDDGQLPLKILRHEKNKGKGAAIRTALPEVSGELVLIQDADLEYDPEENYPVILEPFSDPNVKVVYGSRNLFRNPRSFISYYWGVMVLSWMINILYGSRVTDSYTCYKVFRTNIIKDIEIESNGFELCAEITTKVLNKKVKIHEVPISYVPRTREEGKKIKWIDGLIGLWTILKYRFKL